MARLLGHFIDLRDRCESRWIIGCRFAAKPENPVSDSYDKTDGVRLRSHGAIGGVVLSLLIGAALAPVLLVRIPAMVDYPNHLARMYIFSANGTVERDTGHHLPCDTRRLRNAVAATTDGMDLLPQGCLAGVCL